MAQFTSRPGERVHQDREDPTTILIHDGVPDWVILPPNLGGSRVSVKHGVLAPCPCGRGHTALVLVLDDPTGIRVAECYGEYLWFRPKK